MLKNNYFILFIICFVFNFEINAEELYFDQKISEYFSKNSHLVNKTNLSIKVINLKDDSIVYSYNPEKTLTPASLTKSFTAFAALEYLKPEFRFRTEILFDKDNIDNNGILNDSIYIKFSGDPTLSKEDFSNLINQLQTYNVKKIRNNIIIDDLIYDQTYMAPGWPWDDSKFCFASPTSAIIINKNCFQMMLTANKKGKGASHLKSIQKNYAQVENSIITKNNQFCSPELTSFSNNKYELSGCINSTSPILPLNIAYQNPRLMLKNMIEDLFSAKRISFSEIRFNPAPNSKPTTISHDSERLSNIVYDMMKESDNASADSIFKTMGYYHSNKKGTFKNGFKAVEEVLSKITSLNFKDLRLEDGSGGSRYNLASADQLVELYKKAYTNKDFYNALPILGVDGTLKNIQNANLHEKIRAKTGSLGNVFNLAGYIETNDQTYVFAIMLNGLYSKHEYLAFSQGLLEIFVK